MHILVLPSWYPTKEDPVKGSFFAEQAAALARFGHTVTVMAVYNDGMSGVQTEKCTDGNLTEYLIHVKPLRFHLTYFRIPRASSFRQTPPHHQKQASLPARRDYPFPPRRRRS